MDNLDLKVRALEKELAAARTRLNDAHAVTQRFRTDLHSYMQVRNCSPGVCVRVGVCLRARYSSHRSRLLSIPSLSNGNFLAHA